MSEFEELEAKIEAQIRHLESSRTPFAIHDVTWRALDANIKFLEWVLSELRKIRQTLEGK